MTKTGAAGMVAAAATIVVATACSGSAAANRPKVEGSRTAASVATTAPLKVVATYDAKALGIKMAQALALGPDGNLYLTDASQRVVVVSPAGKPLRTWGGPGAEPGKFRFVANDPSDPTHLQARIGVSPGGTVYVSDSGNHRVEAFTPAGKYVRAYGSPGNGLVRFLDPFDLVADKAGNLYVADDQLETLSKLSPSGKLLWRIGGFTEKNADLIGHMHLETIDEHARLVVSVD